HSVGVVRDAIIRNAVGVLPFGTSYWALPVVGETWDGLLNDIDGFHVTPDHVDAALVAARSGPVDEGGVGGGTGMVCHEFKGGIGTASRVVGDESGGFTVGVLVQANYGRRDWLRVDGVPVGEAIPIENVPSPYAGAAAGASLHALGGAETVTGRDGITAYALPDDRLLEAMARFGRPARSVA